MDNIVLVMIDVDFQVSIFIFTLSKIKKIQKS
jgi:hypothetical protein